MRYCRPFYISVLLASFYCLSASEEHHKRAPSGFTGVRGKKSIPDSAYSEGGTGAQEELNSVVSSDAKADVEKRAPSGFMGMRGKKPYSFVVEPWEGSYPESVYKRAPSGFMGMRGKKDGEYDDYIKRAPSGFMGMRGKKESSYLQSPYNPYGEKRAPMGFVGMRGKKDDDSQGLAWGDKRAPSGFFGMRGKKQPSGFFGMRGKKYPYEFRGKFVGVRGKKMSNEVNGPDYYSPENDVDLSMVGKDLDMKQLLLLLTEQNEADDALWNAEHNYDGRVNQQ